MTILDQLASSLGRRDDIPNKELAKKLSQSGNQEEIKLLAENLWNKNPAIQSDCLKVLYEIGYIRPELISDYYDQFLILLNSKDNRQVWGAMIGLSLVAPLRADELFLSREIIKKTIEKGSVITKDNGVKALSGIAAKKQEYRQEIFPYLLAHLRSCRTKDVPQHAEYVQLAADSSNRDEFIQVLETRKAAMSDAQIKRINRIERNLIN